MILDRLPMDALIALALLCSARMVVRAASRWPATARSVVFLESRWAPMVAGLLTMAAVWFVWRSLGEPGVVHDERAYLLQAEIFAGGHWTAPRPPIADFFEQMHVFVDPAVFAKYPPAHSLMLVPGVWLGAPGLMPAVLAGVSGALTFWLARRLSGVWTALLGWLLWTTAPATLIWTATYFSETTSTAMWLAAACATTLWLDSGNGRFLIGVAAALAWGFEARPLTMVALAIPLIFVIVRHIVQTRRWQALAMPALVAATILAFGPLWNYKTLGQATVDPYAHYSRMHFPFDKPGFGVDPTPPLRKVPTELMAMGDWSRAIHQEYVPSAVPSALASRIQTLLVTFGEGWRIVLLVLLLLSFARAQGAARLGLAAFVGLFLAYLAFAHPPHWIVHYVELLPILHFLAAAQLVRFVGRFNRDSSGGAVGVWPRAALGSAIATAVMLPLCLGDLARVRTAIDERNGFHRRAADALRAAPTNSIVFVRYPPTQNPHHALTRNEPNLHEARSWVVYDRGIDNERLLAMAPDRQAYRLDVETFRLEPLSPKTHSSVGHGQKADDR